MGDTDPVVVLQAENLMRRYGDLTAVRDLSLCVYQGEILGLLMFFTGVIFPIPKVKLFNLGEQVVSLYDLLPPTHAVAAFSKIFTLGVGLRDVVYEMVSLLVLSLVYFALGVWLFQRRQMCAR